MKNLIFGFNYPNNAIQLLFASMVGTQPSYQKGARIPQANNNQEWVEGNWIYNQSTSQQEYIVTEIKLGNTKSCLNLSFRTMAK